MNDFIGKQTGQLYGMHMGKLKFALGYFFDLMHGRKYHLSAGHFRYTFEKVLVSISTVDVDNELRNPMLLGVWDLNQGTA